MGRSWPLGFWTWHIWELSGFHVGELRVNPRPLPSKDGGLMLENFDEMSGFFLEVSELLSR